MWIVLVLVISKSKWKRQRQLKTKIGPRYFSRGWKLAGLWFCDRLALKYIANVWNISFWSGPHFLRVRRRHTSMLCYACRTSQRSRHLALFRAQRLDMTTSLQLTSTRHWESTTQWVKSLSSEGIDFRDLVLMVSSFISGHLSCLAQMVLLDIWTGTEKWVWIPGHTAVSLLWLTKMKLPL